MKNNKELGFHKIIDEDIFKESTLYAHPLEKIEREEPITVGELIKILQDVPSNMPLYYLDDNADVMGVWDLGKSDRAIFFHLF